MSTREFQVGQQVEFHAEYPFKIIAGIVRTVEDRAREGGGIERGAVIEWRDVYHESNLPERYTSFVPFWNARLQPRTKAADWQYVGLD